MQPLTAYRLHTKISAHMGRPEAGVPGAGDAWRGSQGPRNSRPADRWAAPPAPLLLRFAYPAPLEVAEPASYVVAQWAEGSKAWYEAVYYKSLKILIALRPIMHEQPRRWTTWRWSTLAFPPPAAALRWTSLAAHLQASIRRRSVTRTLCWAHQLLPVRNLKSIYVKVVRWGYDTRAVMSMRRPQFAGFLSGIDAGRHAVTPAGAAPAAAQQLRDPGAAPAPAAGRAGSKKESITARLAQGEAPWDMLSLKAAIHAAMPGQLSARIRRPLCMPCQRFA